MREDPIAPEAARTLYGLMRLRAERSGEARAFRQFERAREAWVDYTWAEALARTDRLAGAFAALGLAPGERVAILLRNGLDWVCFDMAGHRQGLPVVGLYTNDTPANLAYVLADATPSVLLIDTAARWREIAAQLPEAGFLREVWIAEPEGAGEAGQGGPPLAALADVLARDGADPGPPVDDPEAVAVLTYTSGTTGAPKGVMLSHRAILWNADAVRQVVPPYPSDLFLSILPMAHAFERTMGYILPMMAGAAVAYAQSLLRLRQDMAAIRPTVIMGVPRFYESIHDSARRAAQESPLKAWMFAQTARIGWQVFSAKGGHGPGPSLAGRALWPVLRRIVGRKVAAAFGGRMRVAVSGGAELEAEIAQALVGLGLPMVEGYGLTEAGPVVTASTLAAYLPGTVGYPLPGIELRLGPRGALELRTPAAMKGYWNRPEETAAMVTADGWLRTGDLARLEGERVRIAGRLKHILVLKNGENVNPQPIETALTVDPLITQACVVGDRRAYVAALLVLAREEWQDVAEAEGIDPEDPNAPEAARLIMARIRGHLRDVPAHAQVRGCHAGFEEWSLERGLLTPTLKLRRERIIAAHEAEIAAIYGAGRG